MRIADLTDAELMDRLRSDGLYWRVGPFTIRFRTKIQRLGRGLASLYRDFGLSGPDALVDADLVATRCRFWPRRFNVLVDGRLLHPKVSLALGVPTLEWALNLNVFLGLHRYFVVHSAVVEKNGRVAILPGPSGRGKSTLCAALVSRGWRLLSDEVALIDPEDGWIVPAPRPISLKNASIDLLRAFAPEATFGPVWQRTVKGTVGHMLPPRESLNRTHERGRPGWLLFPNYTLGASPELRPISKAQSVVKAGDQAINYSLFGQRGFEALCDLVDVCDCHEFVYGGLAGAVAALDALALTNPEPVEAARAHEHESHR